MSPNLKWDEISDIAGTIDYYTAYFAPQVFYADRSKLSLYKQHLLLAFLQAAASQGYPYASV
jgi:hypothetical protein